MRRYILLLSFLFLALFNAVAQDYPAPKVPRQMVNDFAKMLSPDEEQRLEQKLRAVNDSTSIEFAIVAVNTVQPNDIEQYAIGLAREWGIGKKDKNNGILILVALKDRKVDIEIAYGLEDRVTDGLAKRIIETDIKPNFKQNKYYEGLDKATNSLIDIVKGRYKADKKSKEGIPTVFIIFLVILAVIILSAIFGKKGGGMGGRGGGWGGPIFWGTMGGLGGGGGSSWGGGGGGGGGFGGFGGGSFGGGGASGDW
jgi:uncharacterized protein